MPDLIVKIFAWFVEETVGFLCNFFLLDRIFLVNFSKNSLTLKREIFGKEIHQMSWKSWADGGTVHSSSESRELACRGKKSVHNEFLPQENFWQKKKINVPNPGPFFRLEKSETVRRSSDSCWSVKGQRRRLHKVSSSSRRLLLVELLLRVLNRLRHIETIALASRSEIIRVPLLGRQLEPFDTAKIVTKIFKCEKQTNPFLLLFGKLN